MTTAPDSPEHHGPWSMPARFLPVPRDFSSSTNITRIDLRSKTLSQLRALAAKHNSRSGIDEDPFHSTLKGIPERARLRLDSKVATTDTIGTMLPADSPYLKAWRSVKRQGKEAKGADAAAKRAEAARTASRLAKVGGKAAAADSAARSVQRQSQQLQVPAEQTRWRSKLSAFLGRAVDVPQLAPAAPFLDLNKLFIEVMNQGGSAAVTAADGWAGISFLTQRDADLADKVQAVYDCYLQPLEQDLPLGFRPARNIDHLDSRLQQRAAMGCRVPTYEAVMYAVHTAAAAVQQVMPLAGEPRTSAEVDLQQQQQQPQPTQQVATSSLQKQCNKVPSQLVHTALLLLRQAALCPHALAQQLLQNGLLAKLHHPLQDACIAQYKRAHVSRRQSQGGTEQDDYDTVRNDMLQDIAAVQAVAAAAAAASQDVRYAKAKSDGKHSEDDHPADIVQKVCGELQQNYETDRPDVEQPAPKRPRTEATGDISKLQQPVQWHPITSDLQPADKQQLDAARWLLLSRRALISGPPGCDKPALAIPGMPPLQGSTVRSPTDDMGAHRSTGIAGTTKKAFHGFTPKCGQCKTCLTPSLKKPCVTNKARLAQGLPPLMPNSDP